MHILFVCLGNLCRSPLAEAYLAHAYPSIPCSSVGTSARQLGKRYAPETYRTARLHGVELRGRVARMRPADLERSTLVVCLDASNVAHVRAMAASNDLSVDVCLLRDWDRDGPGDVPNPSGRRPIAWQVVFGMIRRGCDGLAAQLSSSDDA